MEEPVAEKVSAVQQLKALDEQRAKILETAKTDALAKANEAVEELNALGFKYALTDLTPKPKAKATTTGNKREPSGNECGYCHFKTIPRTTSGRIVPRRKSAPSPTPSSKNSGW